MTANASFVFVLGVAGLAFSIALSIVGFRNINRRFYGPIITFLGGALFMRSLRLILDIIP